MKKLLLLGLATTLLLSSCTKTQDNDIRKGTYKMISWTDSTKWSQDRIDVVTDIHISRIDEGTTFKVSRVYYEEEKQLIITDITPYGYENSVYANYSADNYYKVDYWGEIDSLDVISSTEFKRVIIFSDGNGPDGPNTVVSTQHFIKL